MIIYNEEECVDCFGEDEDRQEGVPIERHCFVHGVEDLIIAFARLSLLGCLYYMIGPATDQGRGMHVEGFTQEEYDRLDWDVDAIAWRRAHYSPPATDDHRPDEGIIHINQRV